MLIKYTATRQPTRFRKSRMMPIVKTSLCRVVFLAGLVVLGQTARAEVMYQCVDESGHKSFSNIRSASKGAKCTAMDLGPAPTVPGAKAPAAARTPTPATFPKVDDSAQKSRDTDRRRILDAELAAEQRNLEQARKELVAQEETVLPEERFGPQQRCAAGRDGKQTCTSVGGSGINGAKVEERLNPYKDKVALHERNVQAIQKELAKLR